MKSKFWKLGIIYGMLFCCKMDVISQTVKPSEGSCGMPVFCWKSFDTNGTINPIDTINDMQSILRANELGNHFCERFDKGNFHLYYQRDSSTYIMDYFINRVQVLITFRNNGIIRDISYFDSCTYTNINYFPNGEISSDFYCDYSKPDKCYSRTYELGKIVDERFYIPMKFLEPLDSNLFSKISAGTNALLIKEVLYNDVGKPRYEFLYDKKGNEIEEHKIDAAGK